MLYLQQTPRHGISYRFLARTDFCSTAEHFLSLRQKLIPLLSGYILLFLKQNFVNAPSHIFCRMIELFTFFHFRNSVSIILSRHNVEKSICTFPYSVKYCKGDREPEPTSCCPLVMSKAMWKQPDPFGPEVTIFTLYRHNHTRITQLFRFMS